MFPSEVEFIGKTSNKPFSEIKSNGEWKYRKKDAFLMWGFRSQFSCILTSDDYESTVKDASLYRALKPPEKISVNTKPSICKGKKCAFICFTFWPLCSCKTYQKKLCTYKSAKWVFRKSCLFRYSILHLQAVSVIAINIAKWHINYSTVHVWIFLKYRMLCLYYIQEHSNTTQWYFNGSTWNY